MAKEKKNLDAPDLYFNRELSWLEFNDRVLREGLSDDVPLLERLKFLAIVSANLDEFFMIRVAGLMQQRAASLRRRDISGRTPNQQLTDISRRVERMVADQSQGIRDVFGALAPHGLGASEPSDWTPDQRRFLRSYFSREVLPVLTPLAVQEVDPSTHLSGLRLHVGLTLASGSGDTAAQEALVVPVPAVLPRFITLPAEEGIRLARLEDVVAAHLGMMFPGCRVLEYATFRITRDADIPVGSEEAQEMLQAVEQAVLDRRRRAAVRLEISAGAGTHLKTWLRQWLDLRREEVYEVDGMLDATALMDIVQRPGFEDLKSPHWPPQPPQDLTGVDDLWASLRDRDVLLTHPYESFDPVVRMLERAAEDPDVLAIKQTLYRTSGDSPVIRALAQAAEQGKEVTVLVELQARFDEARNVQWARRLEDAGCLVIYGIAGYKTHAKSLLIVRREGTRIGRYVHLGTGNYNDRTARLYSDVGLMTCDRDITSDIAAFFNLLTGYSEAIGWARVAVAPPQLRRRFIDLIEREAQVSTPGRPGSIMAKINSLQDPAICKALYRASMAGVQVQLNVRGICCLRPGVEGVSEHIQARSIVDRFLEHARVFYFRNGGNEEVYLSSADWMTRNLSRRLELVFPVTDPNCRRRLIHMLNVYFADNVKAFHLQDDGTYRRPDRSGAAVRAQEVLYREAADAAKSTGTPPTRFHPLMRPKE